tara:strand:- start:2643 stop:3050 length:408 start_codon:yes stop_codon:yes gene_type:complete
MRSRRISYRSISEPLDLNLFEWAFIKGDSVKSAFFEGKKSHLFLKESKRYYILPSDRSEKSEDEGLMLMRSLEVLKLPNSYVLVVILSPNSFLFFTDRLNPYRKLLDQVMSDYKSTGSISKDLLHKYHKLESVEK